MPRYFFNMQDQSCDTEDEGVELEGLAEVRRAAMQALPAIAADQPRPEGDEQHYSVVVTDEGGRSVYSATLSYVGHWLVETRA